MAPAPPRPLTDLAAPLWLLVAVAVCLPVSIAVFRRIGRWWISADPVPLPADGAWPAIRWPVWFGLGLFLVMQLLMALVAGGYAAAARAAMLPWEPLKIPEMLSPGIVLAQVVPPLVGLALVRMFGRGAAATVGVRRGALGPGVAQGGVAFAAILPACFVALLANVVLVTLLVGPTKPHPLLEMVQDAREPWMIAAAVVQAAVLAPVAEEFIYRGVLMMTLLKSVGVVGALVASSAVFALVHMAAEPQAVLPLFVLGMAMGYVAYRTRSLVAPIVAHALFNGLMIVGTRLGP